MNQTILKRISSWGKFVGILMMIMGILSALSGLLAFVVGAIPGVIMTIMGFFIYKSAGAASEYIIDENGESLYSILDYYGKFLLLSGIMMLIYLILFVLSIILFFVFGIAAMKELGNINLIQYVF